MEENSASVSHELPRVGYGQQKLKSCWYSAYRALYYWKDADKNHDKIAQEVRNLIERIPMNFEAKRSGGLHSDDFETVMKALFLKGSHGDEIHSLTLDGLKQMLRICGPIWSAMRYEEDSKHIVVVAGWFKKGTDLLIFNPFNLYDKSQKPDALFERRPFAWYKTNIYRLPFAAQYWPG